MPLSAKLLPAAGGLGLTLVFLACFSAAVSAQPSDVLYQINGRVVPGTLESLTLDSIYYRPAGSSAATLLCSERAAVALIFRENGEFLLASRPESTWKSGAHPAYHQIVEIDGRVLPANDIEQHEDIIYYQDALDSTDASVRVAETMAIIYRDGSHQLLANANEVAQGLSRAIDFPTATPALDAVASTGFVAAPPPRAPAAETASVEVAPTDVAPTDVAPTDVAPTDVAPTDVAPTDVAPTDVAPTDVAPTDVAPTDVAPTDVAPTDVAPTDVAPTDVAPTDVAPTDVAPTDVAPTDVADRRLAPMDVASAETTSVTSAAPDAAQTQAASVLRTSQAVRKELELDRADYEEYAAKAINKAEYLGYYLDLLCNRKLDMYDKDQAITNALQLFLHDSTRVQVSSVTRDQTTAYKIKDYLKRLSLLNYDKVELLWRNLQYVTKFRLAPDGNYYGTITVEQLFRGFRDGRPVYEDITQKDVEIVLGNFRKEESGTVAYAWDVLLSDIGVEETRRR